MLSVAARGECVGLAKVETSHSCERQRVHLTLRKYCRALILVSRLRWSLSITSFRA